MTPLSTSPFSFTSPIPNLDILLSTIPMFEGEIINSLKSNDPSGLAIAIFTRDDVCYSNGFGVNRRGLPSPVTNSTLFQMASVSKPISATALAILKQKGFFKSYKNHPHLYLPNLFKGAAFKDLKIENMLNHTSGITYEGFEELIESYIPRQVILDKLNEISVSTKPGEQFEYNNVVYGLIGDIMVNLTKKPLETVLTEYPFNPLGMNHACLGLAALLEASDRFYQHMEDSLENSEGGLVPAPYYSHSYYIFPHQLELTHP